MPSPDDMLGGTPEQLNAALEQKVLAIVARNNSDDEQNRAKDKDDTAPLALLGLLESGKKSDLNDFNNAGNPYGPNGMAGLSASQYMMMHGRGRRIADRAQDAAEAKLAEQEKMKAAGTPENATNTNAARPEASNEVLKTPAPEKAPVMAASEEMGEVTGSGLGRGLGQFAKDRMPGVGLMVGSAAVNSFITAASTYMAKRYGSLLTTGQVGSQSDAAAAGTSSFFQNVGGAVVSAAATLAPGVTSYEEIQEGLKTGDMSHFGWAAMWGAVDAVSLVGDVLVAIPTAGAGDVLIEGGVASLKAMRGVTKVAEVVQKTVDSEKTADMVVKAAEMGRGAQRLNAVYQLTMTGQQAIEFINSPEGQGAVQELIQGGVKSDTLSLILQQSGVPKDMADKLAVQTLSHENGPALAGPAGGAVPSLKAMQAMAPGAVDDLVPAPKFTGPREKPSV
ncbi:MAG: hypothetical protein P4M15_04105 [Alphaproteobacteria bacterium]|nr:hypothetical protein [Alphaproteobacteria bacterium]